MTTPWPVSRGTARTDLPLQRAQGLKMKSLPSPRPATTTSEITAFRGVRDCFGTAHPGVGEILATIPWLGGGLVASALDSIST